jgi:hypothetical protein
LGTLRRRATVPRYVTMASDIDLKIVRLNFECFVFSQRCDESTPRCLWRLMMDDVKGER